MGRNRLLWLWLALLLVWTWIVLPNRINVNAAVDTRPKRTEPVLIAPSLDVFALQAGERPRPGLSNEAFIRPEFRRQMRLLRSTIIAAAQRHNRRQLSGMDDREFAVVIAALLYNEHFGWFEEEVKPIRGLTPFYESLQVHANSAGANLSVWPANLRPSVAAEIVQGQIPLPAPNTVITRTIVVAGSRIKPGNYPNQSELYAAISREIAQPDLAVEYLAANLERALYRASYERIPVTWRTLAAWHNQGVVAPDQIANNPTAASYVRRTSAYLPAARALIEGPQLCRLNQCTLAENLAYMSVGSASGFNTPATRSAVRIAVAGAQ